MRTTSKTFHNGSSPLTRGTLALYVVKPQRERFIPAYAGNSEKYMSLRKKCAVHPRLRGELMAKAV